MSYTVVNSTTGQQIAEGLTLPEAAHTVLTDDGQDYDIRPISGGGYSLWLCKRNANRGWFESSIYSLDDDIDAATAEIFVKVIAANWPHQPNVLTDEQFARLYEDAGE